MNGHNLMGKNNTTITLPIEEERRRNGRKSNKETNEGKERGAILQGDDNKVVVVALFKNGVNRCRADRVNGLDVVSVFFRALSRLIDEVCHVKVMDGHVDQNAAVLRGLLDVRRIERRVARRNADNLRTTELS